LADEGARRIGEAERGLRRLSIQKSKILILKSLDFVDFRET
jgi:hypothetical protein